MWWCQPGNERPSKSCSPKSSSSEATAAVVPEGVGKVDTIWALVWHFGTDGKVDRVVNLSGDQHQMDAFAWANFSLAALPDRLA